MDGGLGVLLRGDGRGNLAPVWPAKSGLIVPGDARSATVCDLDQDSWPDLLVTRNDDTLLGFHNRGVTGRRSLAVRLVGRAPNPTAVGARVTLVRDDGRRQSFEVHAGSGYLSQSSATLFFGLGSVKSATLQVQWPDRGSSTYPIREQRRMVVRQP